MGKKVTIEIWGGFHNQMTPVRVKIDSDHIERFGAGHSIDWSAALTENQYKKVRRHLCGIKDCMCEMHHGVQWQEI